MCSFQYINMIICDVLQYVTAIRPGPRRRCVTRTMAAVCASLGLEAIDVTAVRLASTATPTALVS